MRYRVSAVVTSTLQIRVKTTDLNSELKELINNVGLDKSKIELWQSQISKERLEIQ
jgi:hypothetical protein